MVAYQISLLYSQRTEYTYSSKNAAIMHEEETFSYEVGGGEKRIGKRKRKAKAGKQKDIWYGVQHHLKVIFKGPHFRVSAI